MTVTARSTALLATAKVRVEGPTGDFLDLRALLDTGSDISIVSTWVVQALRLSRRPVRVAISGIQEKESGISSSEVDILVRSRIDPGFSLPVRALVLRKLTSCLPSQPVSLKSWPHLAGLTLADPDFGLPARVDLILGADVCGELLQDSSRHGPRGTPIAKQTPFGWVLMGPVPDDSSQNSMTVRSLHCRSEETTNSILQRFWELEELNYPPPLSEEDERTEQHFKDTHDRLPSGRYRVRLPFKLDPEKNLSHSRATVLRLLLNCERRVANNPALASKYEQFMEEYLSLKHMEPAKQSETRKSYYLPHHAVTKKHDPSGKLRVVFNASFPTATRYSLNDCLAAGPKLQSDLWMVLTRWRLYKVVFTTDIVKMFRQIQVHPEDTDWQRILWRIRPDDPVQDYRLTTVTYGTACAPFLALRVLRQLAEDERERYPAGANIIESHSYVDDILAGAEDENQARSLREEVISIFRAGAFELSKWASNMPELKEQDSDSRLFQDVAGVSTLGVLWTPERDTFSLRVLPAVSKQPGYTKRKILAEIASFFDPLGWAAPVLIYAKILMQDLWILGVEWDQELPEEVRLQWCRFRTSLDQLDALSIPRWTNYSKSARSVELHGFCDASQRAYSAAVYMRVAYAEDTSTVLLVAKTKVAPVKAVSVPRLELCGAVLLAKLLVTVKNGLDVTTTITAWTDSSVALCWIKGHASLWKPFVAHRVATIQGHIPSNCWRHVGTASNPADLATRGIQPSELLSSDLWWKGPPWLQASPAAWPAPMLQDPKSAELERGTAQVHAAQVKTQHQTDPLLNRFSTLSRLLSVISYCFRFSRLTKGQPAETGFLRAAERASALRAALRISQATTFPDEIVQLQRTGKLRPKSPLAALQPFLDDGGLLRLGGRLSNAPLPYNEQHPIIVAKTCPLATLLVKDAHLRLLHGGPQETRSLLAQKFWILRGRTLVRAIIKGCVRCARFSGKPASQLMGQLPAARVTPQRAFLSTGVDYAGPILLRTSAGRGHKAYKGYISLFICLATRAIHLEVVSDMSASSFLAAFRRFVSRRGRCTTLLSDNGTVFHGADRELRNLFNGASDFYGEAAAALAADGTDWSFIPPHAPHFGGLWEAGVKTVKYHLRRVIGDSKLTFEEMSTLLCQIEACVNSRPLHALSDDPSDLSALTPGHFLIGEPPSVVPEPEEEPNRSALLSRWRQITQMRSHFWHRWRREYIQHLQQLTKWRQQRENLKVGNLVLIRDDILPPTKWKMGRVAELHTGQDGCVRTVTVRTETGSLLRPIVKLCLLPVADENDNSRSPPGSPVT
ncbi:uncharacterized protein LOC108621956 [Ceratina calcarata]|nr:uncharacterized protein LOC108621956 [Ceratina calcarata]